MTDYFDPASAPLGDPVTIVAGRYIAWRRLIDLDSALFGLKYVFYPRVGGTALTVTGSRSGAYWTFALTAAVSVAWVAGDYGFDVVVTRLSDSEQAVIATGASKVFTTIADRRSHAEIMVEKIEGVIQGRAANDVESYSIGSRSITKMSIAELTKWRDYYRSEIGETAGGPRRNKVKARFV